MTAAIRACQEAYKQRISDRVIFDHVSMTAVVSSSTVSSFWLLIRSTITPNRFSIKLRSGLQAGNVASRPDPWVTSNHRPLRRYGLKRYPGFTTDTTQGMSNATILTSGAISAERARRSYLHPSEKYPMDSASVQPGYDVLSIAQDNDPLSNEFFYPSP